MWPCPISQVGTLSLRMSPVAHSKPEAAGVVTGIPDAGWRLCDGKCRRLRIAKAATSAKMPAGLFLNVAHKVPEGTAAPSLTRFPRQLQGQDPPPRVWTGAYAQTSIRPLTSGPRSGQGSLLRDCCASGPQQGISAPPSCPSKAAGHLWSLLPQQGHGSDRLGTVPVPGWVDQQTEPKPQVPTCPRRGSCPEHPGSS